MQDWDDPGLGHIMLVDWEEDEVKLYLTRFKPAFGWLNLVFI